MNLSKKVKQVALIAAVAFSANTAAPTKPAHAIAAIATGHLYLIGMGSILAVVGMGTFAQSLFSQRGNSTARMVIGGAIFVAGIVLLDGPSGPRLGYTELSIDQRAQFGISDAEYEVYEAQLEEIAALTDSGTASALSAGVRTEQEAKTHFDREYANLEPETLSVMAKILQANLNSI